MTEQEKKEMGIDIKTNYDILRIVATGAVVMIHVIGDDFFALTDIDSLWWNMLNILDSALRWAVPVFVMISGVFFLDPDKDMSVRRIYRKYILRIAFAFVFWSFLYKLVEIISEDRGLSALGTIRVVLIELLIAPKYHLWFVFLIIGLYMITPILRLIIKHAEGGMLRYWMILMFIVGICLNAASDIEIFEHYFGTIIGYANLDFLCGYVFYFVAGYYFSHFEIRYRAPWYLLGVCSYAATVVITRYLSVAEGGTVTVYNYLYPNTAFIALSVFLLFTRSGQKNRQVLSKRAKIFLRKVSGSMFGVYLLHVFIIIAVGACGFSIGTSMPAVFIIWAIVFVTSCLLAAVLGRIPVIGKYIM